MLLTSTKSLVLKLRKKMGDDAFIRYCKNLGIDIDEVMLYMSV